jgi:uncharacterized protein YbjT (DUF2867 family)
MKIVVIGASGLIGSKLVAHLAARGHETIRASPDTGVDALTCVGLADALAGASVVVDVSDAPSSEDAAALELLDTATRNLLAKEAAAGVGHHVALSVAGTQEELIRQSSIPYSIVRAPRSLAADDVAGALGAVSVGPPLNGIGEIGGPGEGPLTP